MGRPRFFYEWLYGIVFDRAVGVLDGRAWEELRWFGVSRQGRQEPPRRCLDPGVSAFRRPNSPEAEENLLRSESEPKNPLGALGDSWRPTPHRRLSPHRAPFAAP